MKYSLVGVDGNAFSIMGYTANALKKVGLGELVPEMQKRAMNGDYSHLICVCDEYIDMANKMIGEEDGEEDYDDF